MNTDMTLTVKPLSEMTKEEREYLRNKATEIDLQELSTQLEVVKSHQAKTDNRVDNLEADNANMKTDIQSLKDNTEVLAAPVHRCRYLEFKKECARRIYQLFDNDKTSCKYTLFAPFLFKKIYADIASKLEVGSYGNISMKNYNEPDSDYNIARKLVNRWIPNDYYIRHCLEELQCKRDNGFLAPERCRALTKYLAETNNREINPFYI